MKGLVVERFEEIKKFAELEMERKHQQLIETMRSYTPEQRMLILGHVVLDMMNIHVSLLELEAKLGEAEQTYDCLEEVYAEEGVDINDINIRLILEGDTEGEDNAL